MGTSSAATAVSLLRHWARATLPREPLRPPRLFHCWQRHWARATLPRFRTDVRWCGSMRWWRLAQSTLPRSRMVVRWRGSTRCWRLARSTLPRSRVSVCWRGSAKCRQSFQKVGHHRVRQRFAPLLPRGGHSMEAGDCVPRCAEDVAAHPVQQSAVLPCDQTVLPSHPGEPALPHCLLHCHFHRHWADRHHCCCWWWCCHFHRQTCQAAAGPGRCCN